MAIRALTVQEFNRIRAARSALARLTDHAVEWFTDDAGLVLGAIAYQPLLLDWSFIVLGRDSSGGFRPIACDIGLRDLEHARSVLVERMAMAMKTSAMAASSHQPNAA